MLHKTKFPELQYEHVKAYNVTLKRQESFWRFSNEGAHVGPIYPTKEALLHDLDRYARDNWGLGH